MVQGGLCRVPPPNELRGQKTMSTVQLVPGVCQVADGVLAYEVKDETGNVKTIHHNRLFLVAAPVGAVMPLGAGAPLSEENVA